MLRGSFEHCNRHEPDACDRAITTSQTASVRVQVTLDASATPEPGGASAQTCSWVHNSDQQIGPTLTIGEVADTASTWTLDVNVSGRVGFGETTVPLM